MKRVPAGRRLLVTIVLACATGCAADGAAPVVPPDPAPTAITPFPPAPPPDPTAVIPAVLIGAWSSSGEATEIAYRFVADGRFRSVEIISQPCPRGVFEFSRMQDGQARVDGDRLVLQPTISTTTRKDPEHPEEDYTERPGSPDERVYSWRVDGAVLFLRDATGLELTLHFLRRERARYVLKFGASRAVLLLRLRSLLKER